ncbi:MAG: class I SAM-dependent methyltransferase [Candidatus Aenigmarchaeota archaeon]|nr:class I SAM-dependent methyltransferase [Candidatus Aenigmarchaeota archaeon]
MGKPKYDENAVLGTYEKNSILHTTDLSVMTDPLALHALQKLISEYEFETVLDIGSGSRKHADYLEKRGKKVTTCDLGISDEFKKSRNGATFRGNYLDFQFPEKYDAAWCCHVLEHQPNVNALLKKVLGDLKEDGVLAVTVPPRKPNVVGGHLTIWNGGLLLYNLIIAGFDCSQARLKQHEYNISVLVRKKPIDIESLNLNYDIGDIERLSGFFPFPAEQGFDGDVMEVKWD